MIHVPRTTALTDALVSLPPEYRDRLLHNEVRLIKHLASRSEDEAPGPP